jgi:hypothetical protein
MEAARFFFWTSAQIARHGGFGDMLRMTANVVRPHAELALLCRLRISIMKRPS